MAAAAGLMAGVAAAHASFWKSLFASAEGTGEEVVDRLLVEAEDRFRGEAALGDGRFAQVYQVKSTVAVKICHSEADMSEVMVLKHLRDCELITRYYNHVWINSKLFIFMELCEGGSLHGVVMREPLAWPIARQLLDAVSYMHKSGYIHRDIKPSNVLFKNSARNCIRLADFGLAVTEEAALAGQVRPGGSKAFLSPDVAAGGVPRRSSDLWACGVTLWILVTATAPDIDLLRSLKFPEINKWPGAKMLSMQWLKMLEPLLETRTLHAVQEHVEPSRTLLQTSTGHLQTETGDHVAKFMARFARNTR